MNAIVSPGESPLDSFRDQTIRLCSKNKRNPQKQTARRGCNHGSLSLLMLISFYKMLGYAAPVAASRGGTSLYSHKLTARDSVDGTRSFLLVPYCLRPPVPRFTVGRVGELSVYAGEALGLTGDSSHHKNS